MKTGISKQLRSLAVAIVALILVAIAFAPMAKAIGPNAVRGNPEFNSAEEPPNDDGSSDCVSLGFTVSFFGSNYDCAFVNNNGNITFDDALPTYTPFGLERTARVIIAAFFADVDTRVANTVKYGRGTIDGRPAFGVNYIGVGYYSRNADKLNDFQLILIDRSETGAGNFDIEFNYDRIQWETGDASGGEEGLGGSPARVGYSNGTGAAGTSFELPGSGQSGAFLDANTQTGLIHNSLNSPQLGRYLFTVRGGVVVEPPATATATPTSLPGAPTATTLPATPTATTLPTAIPTATATRVPAGAQPTPTPALPAFVTVVQRPDPNMTARRSAVDFGISRLRQRQAVAGDGIVDYVIEVVNRGEGRARDTLINMPFDPREQRVLDAKFSRDTAWVSTVMTNSLELHTGALNPNGDTITMTVRLLVRPGAAADASLAERLSFRWSDAEGGGEGRSNRSMLAVGTADNNQALYPLMVNPVRGSVGSTHAFSADLFAPGEPVSLWYHTPDGRDVAVALNRADAEGRVLINFATNDLPAGDYNMVANGHWTKFTAVGRFEVR